jgi:hypothetical protein
MSKEYTKAVVNCSTNQVEHIPMTAEEITEHEKAIADFADKEAKREAEAQAKADAKLAAQAKLQALGLTGEEITAITN